MPADTVDHVIPRSLEETARLAGHAEWAAQLVHARIETVVCCRQCNSALGDRVYPTVAARKAAIKRYLRRRYRRLLRQPAWGDEELLELGDNLRRYVSHRQCLRDVVEQRLAW